MNRWVGLGLLGVATTVALAGALGAAVPEARITIEDFHFTEAKLDVPVDTTVTWVNRDEEPHTVTSPAGLFASPGLDHDEHFSYRFTTRGTYAYYCALHPHMRAEVVVR
jgi:plastocyanin